MSDTDPSPRRAATGRFLPGQSGNPAGKKPGTRNRATLLHDALRDREERTVVRVVIDKALAGNSAAARFVIGLLMPRPRDRPIALELPDGAGARDILAAANATVQAMADGEITPGEALTVTRVLDFRLKALKAAVREAERTQPEPAAEPSPACGRGQGEGLGAPADQDLRGPSAHPSPRPSPASGRGSLCEGGRGSLGESGRGSFAGRERGSFPRDLLHSTCISTSSGWRGGLAA